MRKTIVGGLVAVWGISVVLYGLVLNPPAGGGAYASGRWLGTLIGFALVGIGVRTLLKGLNER